MLKRFAGTLGVWTDPFSTKRSQSLEAESICPGSRQAIHVNDYVRESAIPVLPMPQMAIGSRSQFSIFEGMAEGMAESYDKSRSALEPTDGTKILIKCIVTDFYTFVNFVEL
jgi:hypothetical protein